MELTTSKIREAFDKCQERRYNLTKLAEVLKKYFLELSDDSDKRKEFFTQFLLHVESLLLDAERDFATERCVQFTAIFTSLFADTSDEDDNEEGQKDDENLFSFLITFLIDPGIHCHSNKTVRFRVCQLIQLLLSSVPQNAALDEVLLESITKVMLDRFKDKVPMVRTQAARSLSRLQQPSLIDCPVIEAYLFHIACDDSPQVRAAALSNISLTSKTLPCVLDRTRDVSESIRKLAFQVIAQKVSIKALTSTQRLYLIKQGLTDREHAVREVVKKQLFQAWLLTYDASLIDLLKKLDVVGAYDTCCKAVIAMFECSNLGDLMEGFTLLNENKVIEFGELTPEAAVYWHQLCDHMRKSGSEGDRCLDRLLPSPLIFSEYLDQYFTEVLTPLIGKNAKGLTPEEEDDKIEKEFVAEQLIKIAVKMDLSDNAGRKALNDVFRNVIVSTDVVCFPCIIPPLACGLLELQSSKSTIDEEEDDKVKMFASLISTVREEKSPTPNQSVTALKEDEIFHLKQEIAKLSVVLNEANDELELHIASKDFAKAAEVQQKIDDVKLKKEDLVEKLNPKPMFDEEVAASLPEQNDVGTLVKCLIMIKELLSSIFECRCGAASEKKSTPRGIHPTLLQLIDALAIPSVLNGSPEVRKEAIRSIGVACMFAPSLASRHFMLLIQVAQADVYIVRVAAINAVNDLIRMFGVKTLIPKKNDKEKQGRENSETLVDEEFSTSTTEKDLEQDDVDIKTVLMDKFMDMLDDEEVDVRLATTCLLTRVLASHRILSPAVVSRLILLWYNPTTRDEPSILHTISNFLDVFPYMSKEAHECIVTAFLPVLRVLFNAPRSSPFASINISNVAELIVSITRPSIVQKAELKGICDVREKKWLNEWSAHDDFAVMISNEVLTDPRSPYVNTLCKILPLLDLNPKLIDNLKDVEVLCANMLKDVKDKQAIRHIRKFQTQVTGLIKSSSAFPTVAVEDSLSSSEKENDRASVRTAAYDNDITSMSASPALKQLNAPEQSTKRNLRNRNVSTAKETSKSISNPKRSLTDALSHVDD